MQNTQVLFLSRPGGDSVVWSYGLNKRNIYSCTATIEDVYEDVTVALYCGLIVVDTEASRERIISLCHFLSTQATSPIILFTYERDERFHLNAYQAGVDECIIKPIGIPLALAKIMWHLRVKLPDAQRSVLGRPNQEAFSIRSDFVE